jgi:hypothetical protein
LARTLPYQEAGADMAQRSIEILIGRLITDEAFRSAFNHEPYATIGSFMLTGHTLTGVEIDAVTATPSEVWQVVAEHIDYRLQKARLSAISF